MPTLRPAIRRTTAEATTRTNWDTDDSLRTSTVSTVGNKVTLYTGAQNTGMINFGPLSTGEETTKHSTLGGLDRPRNVPIYLSHSGTDGKEKEVLGPWYGPCWKSIQIFQGRLKCNNEQKTVF